jgi:hypothetical protein
MLIARPALHLVLTLEESPAIEVYSSSGADEARLVDDLEARGVRLSRELLDAFDDALALLRSRTAQFAPGDVSRRAA